MLVVALFSIADLTHLDLDINLIDGKIISVKLFLNFFLFLLLFFCRIMHIVNYKHVFLPNSQMLFNNNSKYNMTSWFDDHSYKERVMY